MSAVFACKEINFYEIMSCSFALTKTEYHLLLFLVKESKIFSIKELSNKLSLERSTIQKAIKSLLDKSLIIRKQQNLDEGGYLFYYIAIKKVEIKKKMIFSVQAWHTSVETMIHKW